MVKNWIDTLKSLLSHDFASRSDITSGIKINKPLVAYPLSNVEMTFKITLRI